MKYFVIALVLFCNINSLCNTMSKPLLWNMESIKILKGNATSYKKTINQILSTSNKYLELSPVVVTEKQKSFAPNNHFYCSIGGYWWPNPKNPKGRYIQKDGEINPDYYNYDVVRLAEMSRRCLYFSISFYLTREVKYYDSLIRQLKAWFIDKKTYMLPNFEYAEIAPGHNHNRGRGSGIIQAYVFNNVIESIRLVNSIKPIDEQTCKLLKKWFSQFAEWADKGTFSHSLRNRRNNIGTGYDIMLINMYLFADNEKRAKEIFDKFGENRINMQISDYGEQPEELLRTKAFSYSLFNLSLILDFCFIAKIWNSNYYDRYKNKIDKAFAYLGQYIMRNERFPYQELSSWEKCKKDYYTQIKRVYCLKNDKQWEPYVEVDKAISIYTLIK